MNESVTKVSVKYIGKFVGFFFMLPSARVKRFSGLLQKSEI